ncbi:hypothetical protein V1477_002646 [Vespula maculifrons]|uniref:Uncharacterized protein n=1 Tax=Vespula maculifrons TaxID=7453 RepID=A0ABD2CV72_VESMC
MANDTGKEQSNAVFLSVLEIKDAWSVGHRSVTEEEEFETGRGHEGVAPRCATLRHTLHQLRRFKGKDRHRRRVSTKFCENKSSSVLTFFVEKLLYGFSLFSSTGKLEPQKPQLPTENSSPVSTLE